MNTLIPPLLRRQRAKTAPCAKHTCAFVTGNASGLCDRHEDIVKTATRWGCLAIIGWLWELPPMVTREIRRQINGIPRIPGS